MNRPLYGGSNDWMVTRAPSRKATPITMDPSTMCLLNGRLGRECMSHLTTLPLMIQLPALYMQRRKDYLMNQDGNDSSKLPRVRASFSEWRNRPNSARTIVRQGTSLVSKCLATMRKPCIWIRRTSTPSGLMQKKRRELVFASTRCSKTLGGWETTCWIQAFANSDCVGRQA